MEDWIDWREAEEGELYDVEIEILNLHIRFTSKVVSHNFEWVNIGEEEVPEMEFENGIWIKGNPEKGDIAMRKVNPEK